MEDTILMDNLHLIDEDGYLIRAAMLAFYKDPEKWVTGSYIKIGYFGKSDSDLVYQDEVHGPLIEQVDKTVDLVYTKYMKALIDYEGVQRIEQFMFHKDAFREILLNAIVHQLCKALHKRCYVKLIVMQSQLQQSSKIWKSGAFYFA